MDTLTPQKVLILVRDMKLRHYECFRANVDRVLRISLPGGAVLWRARLGFLSGFLAFSPGWEPSFFPLRAPYFRRGIFERYRSLFRFALKPVFESFGVEWQPPPLRVEMVLAPTACMVWIAAGLLIRGIHH